LIIQRIRPNPRTYMSFRNKLIFYDEKLLALTPNTQAGGPPLAGRPQLLIQYIRSCPPYLEAVSSIRNLRTRHAVVTRDTLNTASTYQVQCTHGFHHVFQSMLFYRFNKDFCYDTG
jgi:hypothetical protein